MATKKTNVTKKAAKPQAKKASPPKPDKKLSQIKAAIEVLRRAAEPMTCKQMIETMQAKGLWASPGGKTPSQTLYASILRDIAKGKDARFVKTDRGMFTLASKK